MFGAQKSRKYLQQNYAKVLFCCREMSAQGLFVIETNLIKQQGGGGRGDVRPPTVGSPTLGPPKYCQIRR